MTDDPKTGDDRVRVVETSKSGDDAAKAEAKPAAGNVTPMREGLAAQHSRLRDAMRRARLNEAERRDVIVSLREGEVARLEMLQDQLSDVFESTPEESDLFDGSILPGNPPRLWIDVLAYVSMARDRRTYQFVQEARYGRRTIFETTSLEDMGKRITDYVASRVLERERAIVSAEQELIEQRRKDAALDSGEMDPATLVDSASTTEPDEAVVVDTATGDVQVVPVSDEPARAEEPPAPARDSGNAVGLRLLVSFVLGALCGAAALFVYGANYVAN
ncbi:hypothetical protein ACKTEK_11475 [Tepidamorphus sp. 3E244]|uniref:hypothetical protein n=1 Tax=Tepidamorphus sp. 3E244 TaxID=3385498 RepID=UPI0038FD3B94